jgi:hypothetical protein
MPVPVEGPDRDRLSRHPLPLIEVSLGAWLRVSERHHRSVVHFGKAVRYRFDDPLGQYGVLYAGSNDLTSVAESVLRDEVRTGARPVYLSDLDERVIAALAPADATLSLVDLTEAVGIGLDNQIATTPDYALTRAWSRALYEHPDAPDGVFFASRNYPKGQAIAVFDRVLERLAIVEAPGSRIALRQAHGDQDLLALLAKNGIALRR